MSGKGAAKQSKSKGGKLTPMLAQYLEIKAQHPDALLLFRMGDFFETFFEDAEVLARVAGVTLTSRDSKSDHPVPLAGVPHHALDTYLTRLLAAGLTVAICEQVEDPALAKGLVKREVVEIISPGTTTAPELIDGAAGVYCLAYSPGEVSAGWALLDASTGEFRCGQEDATLSDLCERHPVREVIVREDADEAQLTQWRNGQPELVINRVSAAWFHPTFAARTLQDHFGVQNLSPFGLADTEREPAVSAAGALLRYLTGLTLKRPGQVTSLRFVARSDHMLLDEETLRNLEIFRTFRGDRGPGTLLHHIDGTTTAMGRRLLARRLAEPLTATDGLQTWHDGVAAAVQARDWRRRLREILRQMGDLDRLTARAASGRIGPAQLAQLGRSLASVTDLRAVAGRSDHKQQPIVDWAEQLPALDELVTAIAATLGNDPPARAGRGGAIRAGVDAELDRCRAIITDTRGWLADLQKTERERTGIASLKVGFNKVFGYYFEVTNKYLDKVPAHYIQKQTLVNAGRFHTPELKEAEDQILTAEEQAETLEKAIFARLVHRVATETGAIHQTAQLIAKIDLMLGFADVAETHDYCRPVCNESLELCIDGGRHPVVEQLLPHDFIPNDTELDGQQHQILLLTGPNMGGKSTYLRQVALIVLMAQIGSFVPARAAHIGITDRIFTRVGASDNLARGESTFFVEMSEAAHILRQMSRRSLVVFDEIGRGTSTYDGLSLAWAITEFLADELGPRPRSLFATHYHELTELEGSLTGLVNLQLEVREWEGKIIFMHTVKPGRSDKSYGIHVARLAGIPDPVLQRASALLEQLTLVDQRGLGGQSPADDLQTGGASLAADRDPTEVSATGFNRPQLSLFNEHERDALDALRDLDLDRISPVDAFMWLMRIKRQLDDQ
jgi:DNA mismatch repair protein MutS